MTQTPRAERYGDGKAAGSIPRSSLSPLSQEDTGGVATSTYPRLRSDLIVSHQQTADGTLCIVKHPVSSEFFRFGELEQFIAQQLDGETPLESVRQRTEARFGSAIGAETLAGFVAHLEKAHLLEPTHGGKGPRAVRRGRIRGSLLNLQLPLFDPNGLFDRLVRRVGPCFTPQFVTIASALILWAAGIAIANWAALTQDLTPLLRLSTLPLVLAVGFVLGSAHEFAHGLTCKRFGGEVHELGFLLMYFQPGLYTNVSDAWLFPERSKRLWVGFAGPFFELFLWALATLVWRATASDTWINYLALAVMAVSGIKTLLNFNPFIKLDGYYLLSDYLEIPNLRRKAFRYVGDSVKRLFGAGPRLAAQISGRERAVYLAYGVVAAVFSFGLLGYVVVTAGGFLVEHHQPLALLLMTGLVGMRSRGKVQRLFGGSSAALDVLAESSDVAARPPEGSPDPVPPRREKKTKQRKASWGPRLWWAAAAGAAIVLVFFGRMELRVAGSVNVLPEQNGDVRAVVEGIIEEVLVDEGDEVRAGDVIARLSDHDLRATLRQTLADVRGTRATLRKLQAGPTQDQVDLATAAVSRADDRVSYTRTQLARMRSLLAAGTITRVEYEATEEQATAAENDLEEARARLSLLLSGTRPEDVEATKALTERLEAQRSHLEEDLRLLHVLSPVSGVVATPSQQLKGMEGQLVAKGALIARVYDFRAVTAQIVVSEKEMADIRVGQTVALKAHAYPNIAFHGRVTAVAPSADGTAGPQGLLLATPAGGAVASRTFTVTTRIENDSLLLRPGMTGRAKIDCGERRIVDLITRRLARTVKVEFWSWW